MISFTSAQLVPFPLKPELHAQVRLPGVLVHAAFASHPPLLVAHSLMSVQVKPVPM